MSISTDIKALVDPLLTGGCHRVLNRDKTIVKPYGVLYVIAGSPVPGISGSTLAKRDLYQLDVFANTPEEAEGLSLGAIKTAIEGYGGLLIGNNDGQYNEVDQTFQYLTEYHLWE